MEKIGFELSQVLIQDIAQIRSPVGGGGFQVTQLQRGSLSGRAFRAAAPDFALSVGHLRGTSPLRFRGEFERGLLTIVLKLGASSKVWGMEDAGRRKEGAMFSATEGDYDTASRGGLIGHASLRQPLHSVLEFASILTPGVVPLLGSPALWSVPGYRRTLLRNTVFASLRALRTFAAQPNDLFDIGDFGRKLTLSFLAAMEPDRCKWGRPLPNVRMVRAAEDLLVADDPSIAGVADLCLRLGVGRRSLERAFRHFLDVSPWKYMMVFRLSRAHNELACGAGSVTDIATRNGFYELGRFSARYRQLFGKSPSETLASGKGHVSTAELTARGVSQKARRLP